MAIDLKDLDYIESFYEGFSEPELPDTDQGLTDKEKADILIEVLTNNNLIL